MLLLGVFCLLSLPYKENKPPNPVKYYFSCCFCGCHGDMARNRKLNNHELHAKLCSFTRCKEVNVVCLRAALNFIIWGSTDGCSATYHSQSCLVWNRLPFVYISKALHSEWTILKDLESSKNKEITAWTWRGRQDEKCDSCSNLFSISPFGSFQYKSLSVWKFEITMWNLKFKKKNGTQ